MKKYLFALGLFFVIGVNRVNAQTRTITKLDENTIVKDSSGTVLPYAIWQKLMQTGEYNIRKPQGSEEFVAYKMNAAEKIRADERKRTAMLNMPKPRQAASLKEGEKFKGEKFTDINGNKFDLKTSIDKIYVINFWFINCPPCKQEIPELNKVVEKYKGNKEVVFIGIALDSKTELKDFLKTTSFNYSIVDDGKYYAQKYEIDGYPTHLIVGKDGLIKFSTIGLAGNTVFWIEKTIAEQLKGI